MDLNSLKVSAFLPLMIESQANRKDALFDQNVDALGFDAITDGIGERLTEGCMVECPMNAVDRNAAT